MTHEEFMIVVSPLAIVLTVVNLIVAIIYLRRVVHDRNMIWLYVVCCWWPVLSFPPAFLIRVVQETDQAQKRLLFKQFLWAVAIGTVSFALCVGMVCFVTEFSLEKTQSYIAGMNLLLTIVLIMGDRLLWRSEKPIEN